MASGESESVNIATHFAERDTSETDKNGDISTTSKRCRDEVWKGQYCCVPSCRNASGGSAGRRQLGSARVSFHSFPNLSTDKERAKEWIVKIRRDPGPDFVINEYTKVCSEHFKPEDYLCGGEDPQAARRMLTKTAVPSLFSWPSCSIKKRTTTTSQRAVLVLESDSSFSEEDSVSSGPSLSEFCEIDTEDIDYSSVDCLKAQVAELSEQLAKTQAKYEKSLFRLANIKEDDGLVSFYTGFPDYNTLLTFYNIILESDAKVMRQWRGGESKESYNDVKTGRDYKLPLFEQLFLTLVRLRLNDPELDLAIRFGLSQSCVSRIIATWINLLYHSLKGLERFPPWHIVQKYMPVAFKEQYPNTRLVIDCTEFGIERPSSLVTQATTFSSYKNKNTVKVMIGIIPSGAVVFVSPTYEGSISDKKLVEQSGLLDKLEVGDEIMADKGFDIQDLLAPLGVKLNIPPFLSSNSQFSSEDVMRTKKIAKLRIHVERAIGRIKEFRILQSPICATMWDSINEIIYICAMLCNFSPPLVC
ncbi:uncharacterized protein [Dysidea avara]|uniref:uncharacterized protein n=1 Tax=Dysidea avara TaxID=196820 RepID=UPI00331AC8E6